MGFINQLITGGHHPAKMAILIGNMMINGQIWGLFSGNLENKMWKQWNMGNPSSWRLRKVWTKEDFSVSKLAPFWPQSNRRNDTWHSCRLPCGTVILVKALDFAGFSHQNSWINQAEFKSFTNLTSLLFTNQPLICSPKKTTNQFILGFSDKSLSFKHMFKKAAMNLRQTFMNLQLFSSQFLCHALPDPFYPSRLALDHQGNLIKLRPWEKTQIFNGYFIAPTQILSWHP